MELSEENLHHEGAFAGRMRLQNKAAQGAPRSKDWVDEERANVRAYEYLCHVGEAKEWIEACIGEQIGEITELDNRLRDGVYLAKLARFFEPTTVKKIFEDPKLQFRHSDNTNYFFKACKQAKFPDLFLFELTDIYDKKNIPKVIYCIHALSHYLTKKGIAPRIKNLVGQLNFTNEQLEATENSLKDAGVAMPSFSGVEGALAKEMNEETEEQKEARLKEAREKELQEHEADIIKAQARIRGLLQRKKYQEQVAKYKSQEEVFVKLQAQSRGFLIRRVQKVRMDKLKASVDKIIKVQSQFRGYIARKEHDAILNHYKASTDKIVKAQAYVKAKQTKSAYKALGDLEHIPANAIHSFIHLMDDSDKDFQEEVQLENLKQAVIKKIRETNQNEVSLNDLDIKIALLVRNRITLDEVIKTDKNAQKKAIQEKEAADVANSTDNLFNASNFKSLDKEARRRLELYQNLFYILQTQPKYLAKIIFLVKQSKIKSFMDHVLLTLYNFANSSREEFLLLKFFQQAIKEEMKTVTEVNDFLRGNPVFIKMVVHYYRGAKERQYLRDLLQPLVKAVISDDKLDLEIDLLTLYRTSIRDEESKTGEASKRPYDITKEDALNDQEVQKVFNEHLELLKVQTDKFLDSIIKNLDRMPYGIRYIAKKLHSELMNKFPPANKEEEDRILRVIGNLVYYRYMNPAIVAPEGFDVIEQVISQLQRKNLGEISKMLQQISNNRPYENENAHLASLNPYIAQAAARFSEFFQQSINVVEAEEFFQMTDFSDLAKTQKPVIYITPQEIFNTHALIMDSMYEFNSETNDPFHALIKDLGPIDKKNVTVDYSGNLLTDGAGENKDLGSGGDGPRGNEISLTLSSRYVETASAALLGASGGEQAADYKNLFLETKRFVLSLIRVQTGKNLPELLEKFITPRDERVYAQIVEQENANQKEVPVQASQNLSSMKVETPFPQTLKDLKEVIKSNLKQLQQTYEKVMLIVPDVQKQKEIGILAVSASNKYQEILSSTGMDLRNKHRRRIQRRGEIKSLNKTIENLDDKQKYLNDQKQSYQDYINSCMAQLTSNKKKTGGTQSKFVMPFSPQWNHMQELKKNGKVPQFGSFKYGADVLYKKGVLVAVDGYNPRQFDKISLTISSDESGVFSISASILGITIPQKMELKLEDLLQYQFDKVQVLSIFDGAAKVNVNLLLFLINKKFYV